MRSLRDFTLADVRALYAQHTRAQWLTTMAPDGLRFVIGGRIEVANPIYREIIGRQLAVTVRASLPKVAPTWLDDAGRIGFGRRCVMRAERSVTERGHSVAVIRL